MFCGENLPSCFAPSLPMISCNYCLALCCLSQLLQDAICLARAEVRSLAVSLLVCPVLIGNRSTGDKIILLDLPKNFVLMF